MKHDEKEVLLIVDKDKEIGEVYAKLLSRQYRTLSYVAHPGFSQWDLFSLIRKEKATRIILDAGIKKSRGNSTDWDVVDVVRSLLNKGFNPAHIIVWGAMGRTNVQMDLVALRVWYVLKPMKSASLAEALER